MILEYVCYEYRTSENNIFIKIWSNREESVQNGDYIRRIIIWVIFKIYVQFLKVSVLNNMPGKRRNPLESEGKILKILTHV